MQEAIANKAIATCRRGAIVVLTGAAVLLGGCESVPDVVNPFAWFDDDEPAPPATVAGKPGTATADQPYPKLGTVPKRPPTLESQQASIAKGLTADNENARYTDSNIQKEVARRASAPQGGVPAAAVPAPRAVPPAPRVTPPQVQPVAPRPVPPQARAVAPRPVPPPVPRSAALPPTPTPRTAVPVPVPRPAPPVAAPVTRPVAPPPVQSAARYAPPPPVARPAPVQSPAFAPGQTVKVATIYFGDGSTKLQSNDQAILRQVAAAQRQSGSAVRVVGHASGRARTLDAPRRHMINYRVSLDRAHAVAAALLSLGVPVGKLQVEGKGDTAPVYAEYSATGEAANRRTELYFVN